MPVNENRAHALPTSPVWQEGVFAVNYAHFYGDHAWRWEPVHAAIAHPFLSTPRVCPAPTWWNVAIHVVGEAYGALVTPAAILAGNAPFGDYYTSLYARVSWHDGSTWQWVVSDIARGLQLTIPPAINVNVHILGGAPFGIVGQNAPPTNPGYYNTLLTGSISQTHNPGNRKFTVSAKDYLQESPGAVNFIAPPHSWAVEAHHTTGNALDGIFNSRGGIVGPTLAWRPGETRTGLTTIPSFVPNLRFDWAVDDIFVETVWECKL